jgi:hypothetical protein
VVFTVPISSIKGSFKLHYSSDDPLAQSYAMVLDSSECYFRVSEDLSSFLVSNVGPNMVINGIL